jgi:polyhydroxyalkanoate synthesis repressor PhaR
MTHRATGRISRENKEKTRSLTAVEGIQTRTIRRYQNRKLYDTQASRYVTLEDIAEMIRTGVDIVVIDNKTGKDLTSITLTQIIFEEEKKDQSALPMAALKRIIQSGSESLHDIVGRLVGPGMSAMQQARQEADKFVDRLAHLGKISDDEKLSALSGFYSSTQKSFEDMSKRIEENLKKLFDRMHAVTGLTEKVDRLEKELKQLEALIGKSAKKGKSKKI